jgi:hypothetical protein
MSIERRMLAHHNRPIPLPILILPYLYAAIASASSRAARSPDKYAP